MTHDALGDAGRSAVRPDPDVAAIRTELGLSQARFAAVLGVRVATLEEWERGRRSPEGPARLLLRVAARHPAEVLEVVSGAD